MILPGQLQLFHSEEIVRLRCGLIISRFCSGAVCESSLLGWRVLLFVEALGGLGNGLSCAPRCVFYVTPYCSVLCLMCIHVLPISVLLLRVLGFFRFLTMYCFSDRHKSQLFCPGL